MTLNIREEIEKKKTAFDHHVIGLIQAIASGVTVVERKHLKNLQTEIHASPEAVREIRSKLAFAVLPERPGFDDHGAELDNSVRAS